MEIIHLFIASIRFDSGGGSHRPLRLGRDDPFPVPPPTRSRPPDGPGQGERSPAQAGTQVSSRAGPTQRHERQQEGVLHLTCDVQPHDPHRVALTLPATPTRRTGSGKAAEPCGHSRCPSPSQPLS